MYTGTRKNFFFISVVTGIRFDVQHIGVAIILQTGTLVNGVVDPKSVRWDEYYGRSPAHEVYSVDVSMNMRSLNLDEVILPKGEFVTGIET